MVRLIAIQLCEKYVDYNRKWNYSHMGLSYISNSIQQIHREPIQEGNNSNMVSIYNCCCWYRFVIEYEFSSRFVDVSKLLDNQPGVVHLRGSECDIRVESNRETTHYISSPMVINVKLLSYMYRFSTRICILETRHVPISSMDYKVHRILNVFYSPLRHSPYYRKPHCKSSLLIR